MVDNEDDIIDDIVDDPLVVDTANGEIWKKEEGIREIL